VGVLDDAIREHLALKRRQGASDEEVERQEAEALGPARREPQREAEGDLADEDLAEAATPSRATSAPDAKPLVPAAEPPTPASERPPHGDPLADDADEVPADEALEEYGREPLDPDLEEPAAIEDATVAEFGAPDEAVDEDERILDEEEVAEEELADELAGRDTGLAAEPGLTRPDAGALSAGSNSADAPTEEQAAVFSAPASEVDEPPAAGTLEDEELIEEDERVSSSPPTGEEAASVGEEEASLEEEELLAEELDEPHPPAAEEPLEPDANEPSAGGPEEDEDVLEDTPDFLRETPEHERLWFEQKPPRDFDLDR
jgi:CapZ-interacting protein